MSHKWDVSIVALDPQGMLLLAALATHGGVRKASTALGVPRSTVSRRLAQLESDVGAPLVVRTARRFELTDLGSALAARASSLASVLEESETLVRRAKTEPSGTLRIAAAPVLGEDVLPEIVSELVRLHPRLTVDVRLSVQYVDLRRDADVALRAASIEDASDLFATRLGTSTTGFYASPAYLRAHGTPKAPSDLRDHACILVSARTHWRARVGTRDQLVAVAGRVRVDSFRLARTLAVRGAGIVSSALIFARPFIDSGELVPILERNWTKTPIYAVHASGVPAPPKIRAFIELARKAVARQLPA
ncbi:MAG TPA: LysR family transcriptional regulator [Polyangiaceae bacterium]|jgi:DNA-binding transcriptional LysR family regulator